MKFLARAQLDAHFGAIQSITDTGSGNINIDLSLSDKYEVTIAGTGRPLVPANTQAGQTFEIAIKQDASGSRSVQWWSGIRWPGAAVPSLTTTAGKEDVFMFRYRGSGDYRGFVVGQNM